MTDDLKGTLKEFLELYYQYIGSGDLSKLSTFMTRESYLMTLTTFGFKKAFGDENFKHLLEEIETNADSLSEVESILSQELKKEARNNSIEVVSYEQKGAERVTLHYTADKQVKKIYFSKQNEKWKIDFKAGRKKDA